jgi:hypothetical protein
MTLEVSDDYALRSWILGFGRFVRVLSPPALVGWTMDELERARAQYEDGGGPLFDDEAQPVLPSLFNRLATS